MAPKWLITVSKFLYKGIPWLLCGVLHTKGYRVKLVMCAVEGPSQMTTQQIICPFYAAFVLACIR